MNGGRLNLFHCDKWGMVQLTVTFETNFTSTKFFTKAMVFAKFRVKGIKWPSAILEKDLVLCFVPFFSYTLLICNVIQWCNNFLILETFFKLSIKIKRHIAAKYTFFILKKYWQFWFLWLSQSESILCITGDQTLSVCFAGSKCFELKFFTWN